MKAGKQAFRIATASLLTASAVLLAACGGSGGSGGGDDGGGGSNPPPTQHVSLQVVSFGDSLSDVGTFEPIASAVGGGRFTTNPGQVWVQDIAQYYGGSINAAYTIGLTHALSAHGGLGYAEGGATVATPSVDDFLVALIGDVEMPVDQQVASYLHTYGSFNANQLVIVWAGANDVLRAGAPPAAITTVQNAAITLATLIAQIVQNGATHVVLANLPAIGSSPKGQAQADGGANYTQLAQTFNMTLDAQMQANGVASKVIEIDTYGWINNILANYGSYGFSVSNTAQACDASKTPYDTSLMCSPLTYVSANADQTYMFADDLHLSTRMHTLLAQYVEQQLVAAGLGN